jgi:hypothetical protein
MGVCLRRHPSATVRRSVVHPKRAAWTTIIIPEWYGWERCRLHRDRNRDLVPLGRPTGADQLGASVRDPAGIRKPQAFLCTDLDATRDGSNGPRVVGAVLPFHPVGRRS